MTEPRTADMDRAIAGWLTVPGDGTPPDGLLARAMAGVLATGQRPAWIARGLGAPSTAGAAPDRVDRSGRLSLAIVVALALLALVAVGVAGSLIEPRPGPDLVVPPPSVPSIVPSPSAGPSTAAATPRPVRPSASPIAMAAPPVTYADLGYRALPFDGGRTIRTGTLVRFEGRPAGLVAGADVPAIVITVNTLAAADGIVLDVAPTAGPFHGTTLADVLDELTATGSGLTVDRFVAAELDGETADRLVVADPGGDRETALVAFHGTRTYVVEAHAIPAAGEDPDEADLLALLAFQDGFGFLDDRLVTGGGVSIEMPEGWRRTGGFAAGGPLKIGTGDFLGSVADVISVDWAGPDETITVDLGQQSGIAEISGHDLASLLATARAALGASPTKVTIGGEPGWRFGVPGASYVMPLVNLAITWHAGTAYVFEEHLVLDGSPSGDFGTVLGGITFR